ncbi:MAG: AMP-binding protein, partial [Candidatus Lokiarchaeota archaeon]|nr:AMP-binding protein [Candidatus Lokiarchaeota archaeon]
MREPEKSQQCIDEYEKLLPRCSDYIDYYAKMYPDKTALIEYDTGEEVNWKDFSIKTKAFAAKLLDMGLKKGDIVATMLPLLKEHVYLIYACYKIGLIIAPLDLRLKFEEVRRCFSIIKPKAFFFLGKTEINDFRPLVAGLMEEFSICEHWIQFDILPHLIIKDAISIVEFANTIEAAYIGSLFSGTVKNAMEAVGKRDPCLIIFTTGSTGFPKPAVICHENILIQNIGLKVAFEITKDDNMCINLPPSHVGCVTEQLATTIFAGGTSVILHIFDAEKTLDAVQKYNVTMLGQIPALFNLEWRLDSYEKYDLSSLRFALYGGEAVSKKFLKKLSSMAPRFGSGLGLTETAGFVTYTPIDCKIDDVINSVGFDSPLCPISIREPMKKDGTAGSEKKEGEIGEICFSGLQIFLGYYKYEESTKKAVSKDGYCYTGDLGYYNDNGLHFVGRRKFVIKTKGYQVFPKEVENFLFSKLKHKVEYIGCVGVEHEIYGEAIIAFVSPQNDVELTKEEIKEVYKEVAAYKRPSHVVLIDIEDFPLNRIGKTDYKALKELATDEINELRIEGKWDSEKKIPSKINKKIKS